MYICLYGPFSDGLMGLSSFAPTASEQVPALLSPFREPIWAKSHSGPRSTRNCAPDQMRKPKATLNLGGSISIKNVDRGTGESSQLGCAQ
jgi:hypothetical protein